MAPSALKKTDIKYVRLGKSGLKVSPIILGCMSYGDKRWQDWVLEEREGIDQIKAAFEAGINTFDTADMYSNGVSEVILGKAIKEIGAPRESFVILTKTYFWTPGPEHVEFRLNPGDNPDQHGLVNRGGLSRKHIFDSIKASLARLGTDYVDVLQCHRFDNDTPIEETMRALHDVVQAGYARYIGMSSCWAWQFHAMQNYALNNGLTPFISMQNHHSLVYREEEREMNPLCQHLGVGTIPWSPVARGILTRPWGQTSHRHGTDQWVGLMTGGAEKASEEIVNRVEKVAKDKNASMAQVAIAWILKQPAVTAPIVGTSSMEKLKDMLGALKLELTEEEIKYLGEPYVPRAIAGHY